MSLPSVKEKTQSCAGLSAGGPAKTHKVIKKTPVTSKADADGAADQKVC